MEIPESLISLIDAIAWPLVVLIVVGLVRKHIADLLESVRKIRYGELEAEFQDILGSAGFDRIGSSSTQALPAVDAIAQISPNAAIPYAWSEFERAVIEFMEEQHGFRDENVGPRIAPNVEVLREEGYISAKDAELAHRLRRLRNEVAHHIATNEPITTKSAIEYANSIRYLIQTLQAAAN